MSKSAVVGLLLALSATLACRRESTPPAGATSGGIEASPLGVKRGLLLASGLGNIDGISHSNSIEALRCNYRRGFRWFELDLTATAEGELVAFHKGDERLARLPGRIWNLGIAALDGKRYADRFPIPRLSALLAEADKLSDVVLVLDTGGWSKRMQQAVSRTLGYGPKHPTKFIFQVYSEKDLEELIPLSKELDAGLLLNANGIDDDAKVDELARKNSYLGVVANTVRFTPWFAERVHAAHLPVLVQTVDEHRDIVTLSRAGADGFFTDRYVPYETIAADPNAALDCDATQASPEQLHIWTERNLARQTDFRLPACAKRRADALELSDCDERTILRMNALAVPVGKPVHLQIEAEAGPAPVNFWVELAQRKAPKVVKTREQLSLKPKERRTFEYTVDLPQGSAGVEARLGLATKKDDLILHGLIVFHGEKLPDTPAPTAIQDAGE